MIHFFGHVAHDDHPKMRKVDMLFHLLTFAHVVYGSGLHTWSEDASRFPLPPAPSSLCEAADRIWVKVIVANSRLRTHGILSPLHQDLRMFLCLPLGL